MTSLIMRKRRAQPGEIGLFPAGEVFDEQWSSIKIDVDVDVTATTAAHPKYNRLSWHIANLILASTDLYEFSDEARDWLLIHAKHSRKVMDKLRGKAELKPKGTRRLDGTAWLELIPRLVHVATTKYGIPEDAIFTGLSREEFFRRDEPPPITEIPEGPGHNSGPAGVSRDLPDALPPNHSHAEGVAATQHAPYVTVTSGMRGHFAVLMHWHDGWEPLQSGIGSFDTPEGAIGEGRDWAMAEGVEFRAPAAASARPAPGRAEAPAPREALARPPEPRETPPQGPPGEPKTPGEYPAYAKWHIENSGDHATAMGWLWTPAQGRLREGLGVTIGVRKQLERHCSEKFGGPA